MEQEYTPAALSAPTPGDRIRQIYWELRSISTLKDPEEKRTRLLYYEEELKAYSPGSVRGITEEDTGLLVEQWMRITDLTLADAKDYKAAIRLLDSCKVAIRKELGEWRKLRSRYQGAKHAFAGYFGAVSDEEIAEILTGKYKPRNGVKIPWEKTPRDGVIFSYAISKGADLAYINSVFRIKKKDGAETKFQASHFQLPQLIKRANGDAIRKPPEIVKLVNKYRPIPEDSPLWEYYNRKQLK